MDKVKLVINTDIDFKSLQKDIIDNGGYCLCQIPKSEDTKCPCKLLREGKFSTDWCDCNLYKLKETCNEN